DGVLRADRAARLARLRQGQLQGAVRGDRARAGAPRQPLRVLRVVVPGVRYPEDCAESHRASRTVPSGSGRSGRPPGRCPMRILGVALSAAGLATAGMVVTVPSAAAAGCSGSVLVSAGYVRLFGGSPVG